MSGGRIKVQVLPGGSIAPALEVTDTVAKGIAEMGHSWPGYDIGRDATTAILGGYAGGNGIGSDDALALYRWWEKALE